MKILIFRYLIILNVLFLLVIPTIVIGEDIPSSIQLKIDRRWIYIFQFDDYKTLEVNEYFYVNNTGNSSYDKSLNIWIQNNSIISANCCNFTPNLACRYNENRQCECFYLNNTIDNNHYFGYPFSGEKLLSYYGQKQLISITASSATNLSLNPGTLHINATIGSMSFNRITKESPVGDIQLFSDNKEIGLMPVFDPYMPYNITKFENVTIKNNGSEQELIIFNISKLPLGWFAEIRNDNNTITNITLSPKEYANLTLKISAPSNIASIYVRYLIELDKLKDKEKDDFKKQYLYENEKLTYEVYLLSTKNLKVSDDLTLVHDDFFWMEEYERYWFIAKNENVQQNSYSTITINTEKTLDSNLFFYQILLIIILAGAIVSIIIFKKKNIFLDKEPLKRTKTNPEFIKEKLLEEKKKIQELIKRTKKDENLNLIDKKTAKNIITDYQEQLKNINNKISEFEKNKIAHNEIIKDKIKQKENRIIELEEQKDRIYSAIKKIECEYRDKIIGKKDYERFRSAYKKQAIEILKEIDRLKQ